DPGQLDDSPLAQLQSVVHHLPTAIVVVEAATHRVILQNEKVASIWRRSRDAMEEERDLSRWGAIHPDGRPYSPDEWPLARTAASGEAIDGEELEILRGDGTRGVIRISSTPIRNDRGALVAAAATILDVTEERSEERNRRFLAEA